MYYNYLDETIDDFGYVTEGGEGKAAEGLNEGVEGAGGAAEEGEGAVATRTGGGEGAGTVTGAARVASESESGLPPAPAFSPRNPMTSTSGESVRSSRYAAADDKAEEDDDSEEMYRAVAPAEDEHHGADRTPMGHDDDQHEVTAGAGGDLYATPAAGTDTATATGSGATAGETKSASSAGAM